MLSGNNNQIMILIYKKLILTIEIIVKIHVIYYKKKLTYQMLSQS